MKKVLLVMVVLFGTFFICNQKPAEVPTTPERIVSIIPDGYVGKIKINDDSIIRLIVLKHARESLAEKDHREIIQIANLSASSGLNIKELGGHHVDRDGVHENLVFDKTCSISELKEFISEQMRVSAIKGDTFLIYTTGHGGKSGILSTLGMRKDIQKVFAEAAEENNQETLWWQSSCYAASNLPPISSLTPKQQNLFSQIASSSADRVSYWGHCVEPMKKMFLALADGSTAIDPDQNGEITAGELRAFLKDAKRELILFSKTEDEPIFGIFGPWNIPVLDQNNTQGEYDRHYIPSPKV